MEDKVLTDQRDGIVAREMDSAEVEATSNTGALPKSPWCVFNYDS